MNTSKLGSRGTRHGDPGRCDLSRTANAALSGARRPVSRLHVCCSVRESKDPKDFASMDELRQYLHAKERSPITLSNIIHFLGQAALGSDLRPPDDSPSSSSSQAPSPRSPPAAGLALVPPLLLRALAKGYRDFVREAGAAIRHRLNPGDRGDEEESKWPQVDPERYRELAPLMGGLLSIRSLRKAAYKYPPLLDMPPAELAVRLVSLKGLLAACDVALLTEQEPALFLGGCQESVEQRVTAGLGLLRAGLAGADIYQVVMRDPGLLFMPELQRGLTELRELWDVDEAALADSDPQMLALAVRALSVTGLPKGL